MNSLENRIEIPVKSICDVHKQMVEFKEKLHPNVPESYVNLFSSRCNKDLLELEKTKLRTFLENSGYKHRFSGVEGNCYRAKITGFYNIDIDMVKLDYS